MVMHVDGFAATRRHRSRRVGGMNNTGGGDEAGGSASEQCRTAVQYLAVFVTRVAAILPTILVVAMPHRSPRFCYVFRTIIATA